MSEASPTKQKLDEFRVSLPPGDEHTEPKAAKDALLEDVRTLGRKSKVTPAEVKAVAEKHAGARQKK